MSIIYLLQSITKRINLYKLHEIFLTFIVLTTCAEGSCLYCFKHNSVDELVTTACGHEFHLHCITSWISNKNGKRNQDAVIRGCYECKSLAVPFIRDSKLNAIEAPRYCETEAMSACRLGDIRKITDLLTKNPNLVNQTLDKIYNISLLHIAARYGKNRCLQALLEAGGDSNITMTNDTTPLHMAAENNRIICAETLIKCGANIDSENQFTAVLTNEDEFISKRRTYDDTNTSIKGYSPLDLAIIKNYIGFINTLIKHGANIYLNNLSHAVMANNIQIINILSKAGLNFNDPQGIYKPIHNTIKIITKNTVKVLIKCGANVNTTLDTGETCLHSAIEKENFS